jgi:hypothetical protein
MKVCVKWCNIFEEHNKGIYRANEVKHDFIYFLFISLFLLYEVHFDLSSDKNGEFQQFSEENNSLVTVASLLRIE